MYVFYTRTLVATVRVRMMFSYINRLWPNMGVVTLFDRFLCLEQSPHSLSLTEPSACV